MAIQAVYFDVGSTLVNEARMFHDWADWLQVPHLDFLAALGATVARAEPHRRVFDIVAPGADIPAASRARRDANRAFRIEPRDLYFDAAPCIAACRDAGLFVGIVGNQPADAEAALHACNLGAHHLATSAGWGVEKPDPAFFARIAEACSLPPAAIAYVGDRVDNDVIPARAAGMHPILLARGPWGVIHAEWDGARHAAAVIRNLAGLPDLLRTL